MKFYFKIFIIRVTFGEGNLIISCTSSRENYVAPVGRQTNKNNPKFPDQYI